MLLLMLLFLLVSIRGRPIVNVIRMLKIDKTLNWRNCIVELSVLKVELIIFFLADLPDQDAFLGCSL